MTSGAQELVELPTGRVTFLFTDIESSTLLVRLWGEEIYGQALDEHFSILRDALGRHRGVEVDTEGDALFADFEHAAQAVAMAVSAQAMMADHLWPGRGKVRVRMACTRLRPGAGNGYVGLSVHQASRMASAAHGGQILRLVHRPRHGVPGAERAVPCPRRSDDARVN